MSGAPRQTFKEEKKVALRAAAKLTPVRVWHRTTRSRRSRPHTCTPRPRRHRCAAGAFCCLSDARHTPSHPQRHCRSGPSHTTHSHYQDTAPGNDGQRPPQCTQVSHTGGSCDAVPIWLERDQGTTPLKTHTHTLTPLALGLPPTAPRLCGPHSPLKESQAGTCRGAGLPRACCTWLDTAALCCNPGCRAKPPAPALHQSNR